MELEARVSLRRPPLPLAPLVGSLDARANGRVRIPQRGSCRDRVAYDRDAGHPLGAHALLLAGRELDDEIAVERVGDAKERVDARRPPSALETSDGGLRRPAPLGEIA